MLFSRAVIFASGMLCAISILVWLPTVALTWLPSSDPGYSKRITWSDVPYHSLDLCVCAEGLVFGWHNKDIPDVPAGFRGDAYRTRAVQFAPGNFFLGAGFYHGADLCVLVVPIWMIIFLTILAPLSSLRRRLRNQRLHSTTLCSCCHYDLRAHRPGDRCPECGILSNAPIPKLSSRLFQSRSPRFHVTFPTPLRYHSTMPPLLFIHGFPFDASMWQAQSDYFHAYAHQLLTPTLPGFGPTDLQSKMGGGENQKSKIPSTIAAYAHHLHTLIQRLPQPPIIAGFSMGGYILLALLREFPQDAAAAIFIDTRAEADSP
ncbi:MAG TPA: alpha/beta fold hydrolase, partial [Phycisphaerae bacterium]